MPDKPDDHDDEPERRPDWDRWRNGVQYAIAVLQAAADHNDLNLGDEPEPCKSFDDVIAELEARLRENEHERPVVWPVGAKIPVRKP